MKKSLLLAGLIAGVALAPLTVSAQEDYLGAPDLEIKLHGLNQQDMGFANIHYTSAGTLMNVEVRGASEGWHGFHVHEAGNCDYDEEFKTAGSHASQEGHQHGFLDEATPHFGDMPNIWVGASGTGKAQYFIRDFDGAGLDDADGSAVVLHDGPDDYKTDPSGASGGRVACGVIFPPQP